jgi:multidrug resistance efflux pump
VAACAPPDLQGNLNRLVTIALREFVSRRKMAALRRAMAEMASDLAIQAENAAIAREFAAAENDRLSDNPAR